MKRIGARVPGYPAVLVVGARHGACSAHARWKTPDVPPSRRGRRGGKDGLTGGDGANCPAVPVGPTRHRGHVEHPGQRLGGSPGRAAIGGDEHSAAPGGRLVGLAHRDAVVPIGARDIVEGAGPGRDRLRRPALPPVRGGDDGGRALGRSSAHRLPDRPAVLGIGTARALHLIDQSRYRDCSERAGPRRARRCRAGGWAWRQHGDERGATGDDNGQGRGDRGCAPRTGAGVARDQRTLITVVLATLSCQPSRFLSHRGESPATIV